MNPLKMSKRACVRTSVVLVALACAIAASPLAVSDVAQTPVPSVDGHAFEFGTPAATLEYSFRTAGVADRIVETGEFELKEITPPVRLALEEFEIFLPGERKVVDLDAEGKVLRETPYTGRLFRGQVIGGEGTAFLLVANEGLYGVVDTPAAQYSLQPISSGIEPEGWILQKISVSPRDPAGWGGHIEAKELPDGGSDVTYDLHIKAWADSAYKNYASDYANRITSAYGYVANMWLSETNIYLGLYGITSLGSNFGYSNTCEGLSDSGLENFRNWVRFNADLDSGAGEIYANSYALFTASANPGSGIGGCGGWELSRNAPGGYAEQSSHTVQAKDWTPWDTYDPDETAHRGLAAGHELTHNAGSGGHPGDSNGLCNYNIMANGVPFQCKWAWRTAGTISAVNDYAPGRLA